MCGQGEQKNISSVSNSKSFHGCLTEMNVWLDASKILTLPYIRLSSELFLMYILSHETLRAGKMPELQEPVCTLLFVICTIVSPIHNIVEGMLRENGVNKHKVSVTSS